MAPKGNQIGKRMWPSFAVANRIADAANWFFIGSLVVGVVSTILIVWMAGVKEAYWEADRRESGERIAALTTQGDKLRKDTADANARALEAQVALEKFKAWRTLTPDQQQQLIEKLKPWAGQPVSFSVMGEPEAVSLMQLLRKTLSSAGWIPIASQQGDVEIDGAGIVFATGIEIQVALAASRGTKAAGAATMLADTLSANEIATRAIFNPQLKNIEAINIVVGKKP